MLRYKAGGGDESLSEKKEYVPRVERWLYNIFRWKTRKKTLEVQIHQMPKMTSRLSDVPSFGKGGVSDPTGNTVMVRVAAEEALQKIEFHLNLFEALLEGLSDQAKNFIECKYAHEYSPTRIQTELLLSRSEYYRFQKQLIEDVYELLGGEFSVVLYPELVEDGDSNAVSSI